MVRATCSVGPLTVICFVSHTILMTSSGLGSLNGMIPWEWAPAHGDEVPTRPMGLKPGSFGFPRISGPGPKPCFRPRDFGPGPQLFSRGQKNITTVREGLDSMNAVLEDTHIYLGPTQLIPPQGCLHKLHSTKGFDGKMVVSQPLEPGSHCRLMGVGETVHWPK